MTLLSWSLQHKRDTAANWTSENPELKAGQIGIETDTNKFKFGTGANWNDTVYFGGGSGSSNVEFYTNLASFPATGTIDVLYIAKNTNLIYRWVSPSYVEVSQSTNLVSSVNGQTGVVVLDATDVGADPTGSAATALSAAIDYTDEKVLTKNQAWFDSNTTLVLNLDQLVFLEQTGRYKKGDAVTQLQTLPFLGSGGGVRFDSNSAGFPVTGEIEVIYVAKDTGLMYQWNGVSYTELSEHYGLIVYSGSSNFNLTGGVYNTEVTITDDKIKPTSTVNISIVPLNRDLDEMTFVNFQVSFGNIVDGLSFDVLISDSNNSAEGDYTIKYTITN